MGETTAIAWCDHTANFWIGCANALLPDGTPHPGCEHCYAQAAYVSRVKGVVWGTAAEGGTRYVTKDAPKNARVWAKRAARDGVRRRVFGGSLCDPLDPDAPAEALAELFQVIRETHRIEWGLNGEWGPDGTKISECGLDWLLLTKRPWRWREIPEDIRPHIWLLTSISDQHSADQLLPELLKAEGFAVRGLSVEPLLGPVDLSPWLTGWTGRGSGLPAPLSSALEALADLPRIDWVIVGGESGAKARPCEVAWVRSLVRQCDGAGVPCFVKQLGSRPHGRGATTQGGPPGAWLLRDKKGGDPSEWPADLRVRQFPEVRP